MHKNALFLLKKIAKEIA